MALQVTPSQTIGPFFSIGLTWDDGPFAVPEWALAYEWDVVLTGRDATPLDADER